MSETSGSERLGWVEFAKAACIILVVIYHARHQSQLIGWETTSTPGQIWEAAGAMLRPLRMPLFFLVSGLLAAASLGRGWDLVARKRVYRLYYIYFLWAALFLLIIPAWPRLGPEAFPPDRVVLEYLAGIALPWYLWALATYFVIAWATRNLPAWMPIGGALLLATLAPFGAQDQPVQAVYMARCLFFFLIGIRLPDLPRSIARSATLTRLLLAGIAFEVIFLISMRAGFTFGPIVDGAAILVGILASAVILDRWPALEDGARWLAERTLPIYIFHFPILAIIPSLTEFLLPPSLLRNSALALLHPLLAALIAVTGSLLLHRVLLRSGATWLFDIPNVTLALPRIRTKI